MEDTQENAVAPQNAPSHHFKYHLQQKTKENVGAQDTGREANCGKLSGKAQ